MDTRTTVAAQSDTETIVQDLNAKWRNYICDAMGLNRDTFQLAQGSLGLQTSDNSGLFRMADALPGSTAVGHYDAGVTNSRADAYSMLLGALLTEVGSDAFRTALGNYYTDWITWSRANKPVKGDTQSSRVEQWALENSIEAGVITNALAALDQAANSALVKARNKVWRDAKDHQQVFSPAGQPQFSLFMYTGTTDAAAKAINEGTSMTIDFSSSTADKELSKSFADGAASGFYSIFSGDAGASFEKLDSKAATSDMTISGRIGKYATLSVGPGQWYDSAEVKRAFDGENDNSVWDASARTGGYDSFFGQPDGSLSRFVSQLVLVSDYEITVTSSATYSSEEFQQIKTQASFGIWPFFSVSASATHTTDVTLDKNNKLVTTFKLNKGLIQIWGVTVQEQK